MDFDQFYEGVDLYYPLPTQMLAQFTPVVEEGQTALDIGCGDGRNTHWLLQRGYLVSAFDISEQGVTKTSRIAEHAGLRHRLTASVGSVVSTPLLDVTYDLIVASTVLCHLQPLDAETALSRIIESLKCGAHCYVSAFTVEDPSYTGGHDRSDTGGAIINHFKVNGLLHALNRLTIVHYRESVEWDRSHGSPHMHGIARALARKDW